MTSSRDKILAAVKEAVKNPSSLPEPPQELNKEFARTLEMMTPAGAESLVGQFKRELELVSGEYFSVRSVQEIAGHIQKMMQENETTKIAASERCLQCSQGIEMCDVHSISIKIIFIDG